jgi:deoxyribonuclease V
MANYRTLHGWNLSPGEAVATQKQLRAQVVIGPPQGEIETVAGADVSFDKYSTTLYAGFVVMRLSDGETIEEIGVKVETRFPYVPGLLSFRETPPLLEAWKLLQSEPDAVMFDGQGIAHPRRMGIASHMGLHIERATWGCAKSVLIGKFDEPELERGTWSPMLDKGETIGAALRTKNKVKPIYVSAGHLIDLQTAIDLTLRCDGGVRQPEPTRRAHNLVNALRRGERQPDNT